MEEAKGLSRRANGSFYCEEECINGIFEPKACNGRDTCALLINSFPGI